MCSGPPEVPPVWVQSEIVGEVAYSEMATKAAAVGRPLAGGSAGLLE